MDTTLLKSFATSSRTELIREVAARITAVLAPGSPERVEQPRAVSALERAISAGGGGDKGKAHVADKVAYTWFNRIIALRFMDANGYTGIGVVSPAADQVGQPEILAAAKRGQVDGDVVKGANAATVTGLLNGTRQPRPGVDAQAEAYSLLLADYCRYWNRAMPFMFEREGDFTELLIPANVLAEDSVLSRSVNVLTEEVCQDVEVIGWLYQFYISERKDEVFAGFKKNKKAGADEIPAATQLFTPHWIVRYLVENSLGRLWMLNHPQSRLVDQMDYYIAPVDEETDFLKITKPEQLTVIDPACGSGHMLTYAFDLLYAIYEEEGYAPSQIPGLILTNNLYGTEIDPRAGALAAFALTMKAAARRKLFLKSPVEPNICVLEPVSFSADELSYLVTKDGDRYAEEAFWSQFDEADTLGSLIEPDPNLTVQLMAHLGTLDDKNEMFLADVLDRARRVVAMAEYLVPKYCVLVANPPYMGRKNMSGQLNGRVSAAFPEAKSDLFSAFVARSTRLLTGSGYAGFMTPNVWLYLASHKLLRSNVILPGLKTLVELPLGGFRGATVQICAFTIVNTDTRSALSDFVRLVGRSGGEAEMARLTRAAAADVECTYRFKIAPRRFEAIPGSPVAYWFSDKLVQAFEGTKSLSGIARAAKGLVTADNASFVREWWEVSRQRIMFGAINRDHAISSRRRWFPYAKGGEFRRWAGNLESVVNWENDGRAIQTTLTADGSRVRATNFNLDRILKPGIVWTVVTSGAPSFRKVDAGFLFDAAAGICQGSDDEYLLALLNSDAAAQILQGLNPTLNLHPGYLEAVPVPDDAGREKIRGLAKRAVEISTLDWDIRERSWAFEKSPLLGQLGLIEDAAESTREIWENLANELRRIEAEIDAHFAQLFGLPVSPKNSDTTSLTMNPHFNYSTVPESQRAGVMTRGMMIEFVAYAVGCMFGRYSLDEPGLILADHGATLQDYLAKVPSPRFMPDGDNVIPIVDGDWFEDDVVGRFRQFLRAAFGEQHFEENLQFVTKSLGVKQLRDYFVKSFYKDHVKRYKKRPIYWLFSSPKGSFNALIYMHRYTPSTVSTVLTYLREYVTKLESALQQAERAGNAKEADRLRKILVELNEYEHDTLFPKASENIVIDLDDGVKVNYPKFGAALKKIPGLEAASD